MVFQLSLLSAKLRTEFSPQLRKMGCRGIVILLPAVGGKQHGMSLAPSSLQAFPVKYHHDYGFHWLQVATLCSWGMCCCTLVTREVVCVAQINITVYNPLHSMGCLHCLPWGFLFVAVLL